MKIKPLDDYYVLKHLTGNRYPADHIFHTYPPPQEALLIAEVVDAGTDCRQDLIGKKVIHVDRYSPLIDGLFITDRGNVIAEVLE